MPPARGVARRGEGVRRAPAPPLRSAPLPSAPAGSRRRQPRGAEAPAAPLSMAPEEVKGVGTRSPFPRQSGKRAGLAGVEGARRRWQGSFNLPGEGGGREKCACWRGRRGVGGRGCSPFVAEVSPPRFCPWFKKCSLGITPREPGSLSSPLTLSKTLWLQQYQQRAHSLRRAAGSPAPSEKLNADNPLASSSPLTREWWRLAN